MKLRFLFSLSTLPLLALACGPAVADDAPPKTEVVAVATSPAWLEESGTLTTEQVLKTLGANATPEQKAEIEKAVRERNEALQQANVRLSQSLSRILATSDAELARRVELEKERRRMELIRARQPSRYRELKRRLDEKSKDEKIANEKSKDAETSKPR